jgi:16S rRNA (guanine(966)-N(2))-methyltransferase RsmD
MRIIAGEFRSRKLLAPATDATRPITDRVKQSLFDILTPRIEGAHIYDCFAGTGSMGLECLSRGAAHATFFESNRSAATLLRKNVALLGVQHRSTVIAQDLFKWFDASAAPDQKADLVFLDPPYRFLRERPDHLKSLATEMVERHMKSSGMLIFRHDTRDQLQLPPLKHLDERTYGEMTIELLSP